MLSSDLKIADVSKKNKVLVNLKSKPFSEQKSSAKLLQLIQNQRETISNASSKPHNHKDQMYDLLIKQRKVVLQLDDENVSLIKQNTSLKTALNTTDSKLKEVHKANAELKEQNASLKQQLLISQVNCAKMVSEVNRLKRK